MIAIIPERLAARIDELGLTQAQVARSIGLQPPSINRLVRGKHAQTRHIFGLARAVRTSPEYLTGMTDDPDADYADHPELTPEQTEWLELFDALDAASRNSLMQIARTLVTGMNTPTINSPKPAYRGEPTAA
ncbi:helix-turn-helix domain-containing protein [Sphingomonas silueang]|uniref:helix-turn-helix domain-containing protein n=1 Tax=Sphingomonas silueang TaxID=3156617 RepID=UPI0032B5702F